MKVYGISAITLKVKDMEKSCSLYSKIPRFQACAWRRAF